MAISIIEYNERVKDDCQIIINKMLVERRHLYQKISTINDSIRLIKLTFKIE